VGTPGLGRAASPVEAVVGAPATVAIRDNLHRLGDQHHSTTGCQPGLLALGRCV